MKFAALFGARVQMNGAHTSVSESWSVAQVDDHLGEVVVEDSPREQVAAGAALPAMAGCFQ